MIKIESSEASQQYRRFKADLNQKRKKREFKDLTNSLNGLENSLSMTPRDDYLEKEITQIITIFQHR